MFKFLFDFFEEFECSLTLCCSFLADFIHRVNVQILFEKVEFVLEILASWREEIDLAGTFINFDEPFTDEIVVNHELDTIFV